MCNIFNVHTNFKIGENSIYEVLYEILSQVELVPEPNTFNDKSKPTALGCPPEPDGKLLLLKTAHALVTGHRTEA